jgi:signal transduction histidine kinase
LDKDPGRVPQQLERLQDLTSSALSQMRSLITQWRPK